MKKLIALVLILISIPTMAQHRHGHHNGHYQHGGHSWGWIAPALISGAIVYSVTRPVPTPPIVYQPQILPPAPYGYRYEQILDANCNCYRWVLVQG